MAATHHPLHIPAGSATLQADLQLPVAARGLVLFAHGSGSSRFSPRNRHVAQVLNDAGLATVLADLLTPDEEAVDDRTRHLRFDIDLLANRLVAVTDWLGAQPLTGALKLGHFGASTGAAAAVVAASRPHVGARAVVSRGGRPDLAASELALVDARSLLIVGGDDGEVLEMNRIALRAFKAPAQLEVVPG
ncbi:MAG TPA: hydrolase, partial [Albitalea sp.]|nr:hydrolase [Albitalea sp.]